MRYYSERYFNPYKDYDWDNDGFPGEYIYGDDYYVDECYMDERWKQIVDFPDYWISDCGRIYSTISDSFIKGTPTGRLGHMDVSLRRGKKRYHRYIHRLVAEAFIPNPDNLPLVRHLDNDPSNNYMDNLAWGTVYNNVHDCIDSGNFRYFTEEDYELAMQKRRTPIVAVNLKTGEETSYISQQEASRQLDIRQSSIHRVLTGKCAHCYGYYFYYANNPKKIDVSSYKHTRHGAPIKAIDLRTGEEFIFRGQTEAARELGLSISSISVILSGKSHRAKGYTFEYADEEDVYV